MLLPAACVTLLAGVGAAPALASDCTAGSTCNVATEADLQNAIQAADQAGSGHTTTIDFTADITLTADLPVVYEPVVINGQGHKLNGAHTYRGFLFGVAGRLARLASPADRNASRQPLSVAAVTPSERDTMSRSSPRRGRSTASRLRCRDIRPPPPAPTVSICCVVIVHPSHGYRPLTGCLIQLWSAGST